MPEAGATWHVADIADPGQLPQVDARILIHLAPLWLLPPLLPILGSRKIVRIIGFGSTSLFSKTASADGSERQLAARLGLAEETIARTSHDLEIRWTVFRPTLVYDGVHDGNVAMIRRFIRRYGFFPLLGKARGLRQPVHADDLAQACLQALDHPATFCRAYNLSGGETLEYRAMVERIAATPGRQAHFIRIPVWLFHGGIRLARMLPGQRHLSTEMATRMNVDLCFDHADATRDFGFSPRPFLLQRNDGGNRPAPSS